MAKKETAPKVEKVAKKAAKKAPKKAAKKAPEVVETPTPDVLETPVPEGLPEPEATPEPTPETTSEVAGKDPFTGSKGSLRNTFARHEEVEKVDANTYKDSTGCTVLLEKTEIEILDQNGNQLQTVPYGAGQFVGVAGAVNAVNGKIVARGGGATGGATTRKPSAPSKTLQAVAVRNNWERKGPVTFMKNGFVLNTEVDGWILESEGKVILEGLYGRGTMASIKRATGEMAPPKDKKARKRTDGAAFVEKPLVGAPKSSKKVAKVVGPAEMLTESKEPAGII